MKHLVLCALSAITLHASAQTDSVPIQSGSLLKNQIVFNMNLIRMFSDVGPFFQVGYLRLKRSVEQDRKVIATYHSFVLDNYALTTSLTTFDKHTLIAVDDTTSVFRSAGTLVGGVNLRYGLEKQRRLVHSGDWGGLQVHSGWYGCLGYVVRREQYIHPQLAVGNELEDELIDWDKAYPVAGERRSDYLRVGAGLVLGLDALLLSSLVQKRCTISIGITMSVLNLNADFLLDSNTRFDDDGIYTGPPKKLIVDMYPDVCLRVAVMF